MTTKTIQKLYSAKTLGELKQTEYKSRSVKDEMRENLISAIKERRNLFEGIQGYEETVIPEIERAILARHSMNLLGLRGQAKTRIARSLIGLLDEYIPVIEGSQLREDPLLPITSFGKERVKMEGDDLPISWLHKSERYSEKLATPDVTVADLIGDVDPIKAANLKLDYSNERVIHYGLVPRSHRGIFVINELPDLQPRIQVALFNILQEGDIQIRGFQLRIPLDIQFVFTANPEDYTNRGAIITPLKDRIQSQILTHYPKSIEVATSITKQEAKILPEQSERVVLKDWISDLLEEVSFAARESELIDQKSGVSARLSISAMEHLIAAAELRTLISGAKSSFVRVGDLSGIVPAITGKVELVYEGEQDGPKSVALSLIGKAIRTRFPQVFPDPEMIKRRKKEDPYQSVVNWFNHHELELLNSDEDKIFESKLKSIDGLQELVERYVPGAQNFEQSLWMEFVLHGLGEYNLLNKTVLENSISFSDLIGSLFQTGEDEEDYNFDG
jgi:magnesium chelatase subunit I